MRKILVLRGGALGDFIVTLPALAALKRRWPGVQIDLVGNATAAEIGKLEGLIQRVHSQHEARWSALYADGTLPRDLADWLAAFDLIVNYWPDPDGVLARHFPVRAGQRFLSAAAMPLCAPAAGHYCAPLRDLGIETPDMVYRLSAGRDILAPPDRVTAPIAIHPGSGSPRKNWPIENWVTLIRRLSSPILLIVGEAESSLIPTDLPKHVRIAANAPFESLITELRTCRVFLGHDSGISHLAAACGVPCILLFGPTDPALWAPPAPHVSVIHRRRDLGAIDVDEVLRAVPQN
jgi:heptosyltransferase III